MHRARLEIPVLDETRCTACRVCVLACPVQCLSWTGWQPWLPRPKACVSCSLCVLICPSQALRLGEMDPV